MEYRVPYLQEFATGLYQEPDESSPHPHILFKDSFHHHIHTDYEKVGSVATGVRQELNSRERGAV